MVTCGHTKNMNTTREGNTKNFARNVYKIVVKLQMLGILHDDLTARMSVFCCLTTMHN